MPTLLYCYHSRSEVPMLDEQEWEEIGALLGNTVQQIQAYREQHGCSLRKARENYGQAALQRYFEMTGVRERYADALWTRRLARYGPPCHRCGKPLRTPKAKHCAECGEWREGWPR